MRLSDLKPGNVIVGKHGFRWRVLRVEPISRMFQWEAVIPHVDLVHIQPPAKWSPPHTAEEWLAEQEGFDVVR